MRALSAISVPQLRHFIPRSQHTRLRVIPVQDVVPSGRPPVATIALLVANAGLFALPRFAGAVTLPPAWGYADTAQFVIAVLYLWLFGDNVEARLGRLTLPLIFVLAAMLAVQLPDALGATATAPGLALAGGVTGVVGAYFLLLPRARVLILVPTTSALVEVPAMFFFGLWWAVQFLTFVVGPAATRLEFDAGGVMWGLATALVAGAGVARLTRRPVSWS